MGEGGEEVNGERETDRLIGDLDSRRDLFLLKQVVLLIGECAC